ncbi:MAG TPA: hypothetical protein PK252_07230 [Bacteroidales bacterium]|nr:hypothetical protein [Bacteroidales bacterium]
MMKFENENDLKLYSDYEHDVDTFLSDVEKKRLIDNLQTIQVEYIESQHDDKKTPIRLSRKKYYFVAVAMLILLIGVAGVLKFSILKTTIEGTDIFLQYYSVYKVDGVMRSDINANSELSLALEAYSEGNFGKASSLLKSHAYSGIEFNKAQFYFGLASIELADYQVAIEAFNKVLSNGNNPYIAQSHWYLALTWLKLNNYNAAKEHLQWLQQNDRFYGKKAKEIFNKLNDN